MSGQTWSKSLLALICFQLISGACLTCAAAESAVTKPGPHAGDADKKHPVEEVTVSAEHLMKMKAELEQAQDAFFAEYNRANTIPEFQTRCDLETDSATRLSYHECTPRFVVAARANYAQMTLRGENVAPPIFSVNGKMPAYGKHVHDVADHDPKLAEQARRYLELSERYEAFYKARFEGPRLVSDH